MASELKERKKHYHNSRVVQRQCKMLLEQVQTNRVNLFMKCFEHISNEVDSIYKVHVGLINCLTVDTLC